MSVAGGISAGAVYGNKGEDSFVLRRLLRHPFLVGEATIPPLLTALLRLSITKVASTQTLWLLTAL